jgi:thiamine-monophosphate kinase
LSPDVATEFDLIKRFFSRPVSAGLLGGGDDCALFATKPGLQVATSTDLLLEGRHFFSNVDPCSLGHKALAVNLSDLAAVGARPIGCLLGLGLPKIDEAWVQQFAEGFYALASKHGCELIGGDTTRSLQGITLSVTVFGEVEPGMALRRNAAQAGDDIWLSGTLGAADIACRMLAGEIELDSELLQSTRRALEWPTPRVELGQQLCMHAHAAIDVSDGLLQDLGHILAASAVGAELQEHLLPLHPALIAGPEQVLPPQLLRQAAFAGGDVYELCFTAAPEQRARLEEISQTLGVALTPIGKIRQERGLVVYDRCGKVISELPLGFDHFRFP